MIKVLLNTIDITELVASVEWTGDDGNIARSLSLSYLYATSDYYVPKNYPNLGDSITFYVDNLELFKGKIFNISNSGKQGVIDVVAYDDALKLGNSTGTFNFKGVPAEVITSTILKEVGLEQGSIAQTKIPQKKLYDDENLYDIITESYKNASLQNGKSYINFIAGGKFHVVECTNDSGVVLDDKKDIISVSFTEDATNIINRVKVYDENQQYLETVDNTELIGKFGVFQAVYTAEEDKQSLTVAKQTLKDISRSVSIECLGNYRCVTGYLVTVNEQSTGLSGKFLITSDTHTWESGQYKMALELKFIS